MLSKKIKTLIFGITCISFIGWAICLFDINRRFPEAVLETYDYDNPAKINGLQIVPIKNNLYTQDEFKNEYPSITKYDEFTKTGNDRYIVYEIEITNTIYDNILFQALLMEAYESTSCWSNGCFVIEEGMLAPIVKPQEKIKLHIVAFIQGDNFSKRQIELFKCEQFGLTLSYYPNSVVLKFK